MPSGRVGAPSSAEPAAPLNFHMVVSEEFLNRLLARDDTEPQDFRDRFLDTQIAGRQVTATHLGIDLQPCKSDGRWLMVLDGNTRSSTAGYPPQAVVVHSVGRQQFRATKEIVFDGYQLSTRHAVLSVQAENRNVGAVTKFTGRPLGPLAEHVVLWVAESRQPAAHAFARDRVIKQVYPRFDGEIDAQLANGNRLLKETVQARLKAARLMPDRLRVETTATHLSFSASMVVPSELTELPPVPAMLVEGHGLSICVHESLLQGILNRGELEGKKTSNQELVGLLTGLGLTAERPLGGLDVDIDFIQVDPVVVHVGEDETRITLRAAFKPGGHHLLAPFEVTIPYRMVKQEEMWLLKAGPIEPRRLKGHVDEKVFAESVVIKLVETSLPIVSFQQELPASLAREGKTPPRITSIRSTQGWLVFGID